MVQRLEDRVVAEALAAARRPDDQDAVDPAFEGLDMAIGPAERQRADEMRVAAGFGALFDQPVMDPAHPLGEVAAPVLELGPARREDAGLAAQCLDAQPLSSDSAGSPVRSAEKRALSSALAAKLVPVSSGSGTSSAAAEIVSIP
jgi:hypothetical protein